jgi:Fur family transcriptional regulator, zinc uptake regulator
VYDILKNSDKPISAYHIKDICDEKDYAMPIMSIYRILDFLIELKVIHKINNTNTYVLCSGDEESEHKLSFLFVCKKCSKSVERILDNTLLKEINLMLKADSFKLDTDVVEIIGSCSSC